MERLTERTTDGILVKEDYGKEVLKTLYSCYGGKPNPHYTNCEEGYCAMEKLADYEDAEEQGLLLRLPCKVGDTVYAICTCEAVGKVLDGTMYDANGGFGTATGYYCPYELSDKCPHTEADDCEECKNIEAVFEDTVDNINITEYEMLIELKNTNLCVTLDEIGKTVFLTKSEAEAKLKELRGRDDER